MAIADQLVELMFSWIEKRENCAMKLKKLADELKTLREKCNTAECAGSTVSMIGAASLIGAGVVTFCTGGAAAPALAIVGGVLGVVGVAVSVTTKIIEHFSSSDTLKDAEKIEEMNKEIAERIQNLFEQLKVEVKRMYPSADPDQVDRHVMASFMGAVARRSGLKLNIDFSQHESFYFTELIFRPAMKAGLTKVCGIFKVFSLKTAGKQTRDLIAEATKKLIKEMSSAGLKTAIEGGAMVVGGAVGMGFALHEAIDNWKHMIKNNHETEASRSLRDTADDILKNCGTLKKEFDDMRTTLEEMDRRQREEEEKARKQLEEEEKARRRRRLGLLVVGLLICLVFSYYRGNIMSSDPVQEKSVNLMTQTDLRHVIEPFDQSEQTGREQETNSQQTVQTGRDQGDEERDDEDKERDQCEIYQTPPGTIRSELLNVQSMNPRTSRISELITGNNLDVFLTTETWLRDETAVRVLREASPEGFRSHYQVRDDRRGGGVANQFSEELQGEQIHFDSLNITTFEFFVTELKHDYWGQPVVIVNLYHPPGYNQQQFHRFLNEFQSLLDEVSNDYSSIIVTGDFNIHVNEERGSYTDEFDFLLLVNNLMQHVEEPTHQRGNTLDLVITTNVEVSDLSVHDDGISDH